MNKNFNIFFVPLILFSLIISFGCIRTTHEIKPIHITMDINLKVDKALDDFFSEIDEAPIPEGENLLSDIIIEETATETETEVAAPEEEGGEETLAEEGEQSAVESSDTDTILDNEKKENE
ncbi:MAG: hypothetical protein GX804_11495 [Lentisphaerae bacterium]|jgi:hypothetical protein|nr:hypothetical protein [Lentisphaerota bacterium]